MNEGWLPRPCCSLMHVAGRSLVERRPEIQIGGAPPLHNSARVARRHPNLTVADRANMAQRATKSALQVHYYEFAKLAGPLVSGAQRRSSLSELGRDSCSLEGVAPPGLRFGLSVGRRLNPVIAGKIQHQPLATSVAPAPARLPPLLRMPGLRTLSASPLRARFALRTQGRAWQASLMRCGA